MFRSLTAAFVVAAILLISTAGVAWTQAVSGTIQGTVTDPTGNLIVGANVTLTNEGTADRRSVTTNATGNFNFVSIPPGTYDVRVESKGFQAFQKTGNVLSSTERLSLGSIQLTIGSVTETVSVSAQALAVQTVSAEGSSTLSSRQVENLSLKGRNPISLLRLMPGVATNDGDLEAAGNYDLLPNVAGVANSTTTYSIDGLQGNDLGTTNRITTPVSPDSVAEVKVLLNNYQAEYGRNGGSSINVVTKSGTRDFHGTVYWYKRHEMFNANNFFNNRNSLAKPRYRYGTEGFTLGGPVTIPRIFNTSREKLFFFYNLESNPSLQPSSIGQYTMPSALERTGDFSQSLDASGKLLTIKDPTTGLLFSENKIPGTRIRPNGLALLNVLRAPNMLDRTLTKGTYNYQFQSSTPNTRVGNLFRVDYRVTDKDSLYFRGTIWEGCSKGGWQSGWEFFQQDFCFPTKQAVLGYTRIITSTIVNEFNAGLRRPFERTGITDVTQIQRKTKGFNVPQLFPGDGSKNPYGILPDATFTGAISNAPGFGGWQWGRFPQQELDIMFYFNEGLSIIRGSHTFKVGMYGERDRIQTGIGAASTPFGQFQFNRDTTNPIDSNHPYSNVLLGNFLKYTESTARTIPVGVSINVDWYVQDSWKVTRRLTLELGLRVAYYTPWYQPDGNQSAWSAERYDRSKVPVFYQPTLVAGKRLALNPLTGVTGPAPWIGGFVPGSGNPANGMVTSHDGNYPGGFTDNVGEMLQPRFGLAWDVFGDGKMAIRTGFSKSNQLNRYEPQSASAPISYDPTIFYDNIDTYASGGTVLSPGNVFAYDRYSHAPNIYNVTFGIQRDLGSGMVLDAKYVGVLGRNLMNNKNINTLPYGARFLAQNVDPTTGKAYADNFLRPYPGYGNITWRETNGSSNYHALQTTLNHRLSQGLEFGVAYTYSKTMDYTGLPVYRPRRVWSYGKATFDQTHIFALNYSYDIPRLSRFAPNPVVRLVFDNWQISGVTSFSSGTPGGITLSTTSGADLTGGGDGQRVIVTGDPRLAHGERGLLHMFNTSVFASPGLGDPGNAPKDVYRGPGINNWDLTLFKNFPLKSEQRSLQVRWEAYNAFNHTQFSGVDNTARFDSTTGAQVNGLFGTATSARPGRVMQASLRFRF
jgi:hypothetical protein